jgi:2-dehydropantoate 2-reductase
MNEKTAMSRFPGWFVAWAAFTIAAFAWGAGFYGPSVFLQTLHVTHGWPVAIISLAVTIHFLLSALIITYLPAIHRTDTAAITLQNGMDKDERLRAVLGRDHILDGAAYIASARVASPGVIVHVGKMARIVFGEADCSRSARGERFLAACKSAGLEAIFSTEIAKELWAKFALLSAFSGVSSVLRQPVGEIAGDGNTRKLFADAIKESVAIAKAKGVDLGDDYLANQWNFLDRVPPETKSSMQMDLEAGRRLELDWMSGAVARIGDELGVPTSIHHFIYAALKLYAGGSH